MNDYIFTRVNEQILKPKSHLFGRLRLLILSLPFVAAVLLQGFVVQEIFSVSEVATFAEIGSVITGVTLILVVTLQASLAVVTFPSPIMSWVAPSVLSLAYGYLLLLVRDLDKHFGHGENNGQGSGADVDIRSVMVAVQQLG